MCIPPMCHRSDPGWTIWKAEVIAFPSLQAGPSLGIDVVSRENKLRPGARRAFPFQAHRSLNYRRLEPNQPELHRHRQRCHVRGKAHDEERFCGKCTRECVKGGSDYALIVGRQGPCPSNTQCLLINIDGAAFGECSVDDDTGNALNAQFQTFAFTVPGEQHGLLF